MNMHPFSGRTRTRWQWTRVALSTRSSKWRQSTMTAAASSMRSASTRSSAATSSTLPSSSMPMVTSRTHGRFTTRSRTTTSSRWSPTTAAWSAPNQPLSTLKLIKSAASAGKVRFHFYPFPSSLPVCIFFCFLPSVRSLSVELITRRHLTATLGQRDYSCSYLLMLPTDEHFIDAKMEKSSRVLLTHRGK